MSITVNLDTYSFDSQRSPDHLQYNGPDSTLSVVDRLAVKRTPPKPSGDFLGQGKASVKLTRTVTVGTDTGTGILEISSSLPVGGTVAQMEAMIDDLAVWLATASAKSALIDQDINQ